MPIICLPEDSHEMQMIHMKYQSFFSLKNKFGVLSADVSGALRANSNSRNLIVLTACALKTLFSQGKHSSRFFFFFFFFFFFGGGGVGFHQKVVVFLNDNMWVQEALLMSTLNMFSWLSKMLQRGASCEYPQHVFVEK